jgi:flagellar biosynthesis/type III secretory pathway protein FliH
MLRLFQRDVLRLALAVAERITKRVVQTDAQVAAAQLEAVLGVIVRPTELTVRIHPDDREVLSAALPQIAARFSQARHIELVDDASLMRGSCVAATRAAGGGSGGGGAMAPGEIDASIQTQIDRIVEAMLPGDGAGEAGE